MKASLEAYAEDNAPHQVCHPKEQADRVNLNATRYEYWRQNERIEGDPASGASTITDSAFRR